jgi:CBS domain-containing protein
MKVQELMARPVETCRPDDTLDRAARIMWERDCGCVPVVQEEDGGARVVGMLTDRDLCMAAYTQGKPLAAVPASSAMAREVRSCRPEDSMQTALGILRANQLHRLPVVDRHDHLVGMLSLADIAREATREHGRRRPALADTDVALTVEAISEPRGSRQLVSAA